MKTRARQSSLRRMAEQRLALTSYRRMLENLVQAVAQEAHTLGRLYHAGGEKLGPAEEFARVQEVALRMLRRELP